jgi:aldehyde dehydrogenase (NAD+)
MPSAITGNAGQVCVAGSRLIVQKRIAPTMLERIARRFEAHRPGATWDEQATLPPIVSAVQARQIDEIVGESVAAGGRIALGGGLYDGGPGGAYYRPTLIEGVTPSNRVVQQEIFGPVLTVQTFDDEAEGLALAAHERYGLACGVRAPALGRAWPRGCLKAIGRWC